MSVDAAIIIAFRDRGVDPLRQQNLDCVREHWAACGDWPVFVVDDGREGDAHFNRHIAYNRGAALTDADVLCYLEADILLPYEQLHQAITSATEAPGMVVAFSYQHKLSATDSMLVRAFQKQPTDCTPAAVINTKDNGINHGCAGVISRATLEMAGKWDERFEGHGNDDTAMAIAFDRCAGRVRCVPGIAHHLYHLDYDPNLTAGDHITPADKRAQQINQARLHLYQRARLPTEIRRLTAGWSPW